MSGPMPDEEVERRLKQLDCGLTYITSLLSNLDERLEVERQERHKHLEALLGRVEAIEEYLAEDDQPAEDDPNRIKAPPSESGRWRVEVRMDPECIGQPVRWVPWQETDSAEEAELWANMAEERRIVAVPLLEAN